MAHQRGRPTIPSRVARFADRIRQRLKRIKDHKDDRLHLSGTDWMTERAHSLIKSLQCLLFLGPRRAFVYAAEHVGRDRDQISDRQYLWTQRQRSDGQKLV